MSYPKIQRLPEVLEFLQISRSNLYKKIQQGLWPKPINLGARAIGFLSTESELVLAAMIAGKATEEIKVLVKILEESRKQFKGAA
jgi:prophage regulatory protein